MHARRSGAERSTAAPARAHMHYTHYTHKALSTQAPRPHVLGPHVGLPCVVAQSQCLPVRNAVPAGSCAVLAPAAAFSWGAAYDTWSRYSRSAGRSWTVRAVSSPRTPRMSWRRLPWRQQMCAWGIESLGGTVSVSASTPTSSWLAQRCYHILLRRRPAFIARG